MSRIETIGNGITLFLGDCREIELPGDIAAEALASLNAEKAQC